MDKMKVRFFEGVKFRPVNLIAKNYKTLINNFIILSLLRTDSLLYTYVQNTQKVTASLKTFYRWGFPDTMRE